MYASCPLSTNPLIGWDAPTPRTSMDNVIKQLRTTLQTLENLLPIIGQLLRQPSDFFRWRSERADARRREALDLFASSIVWMIGLYYVNLASARPVKELHVYLFATFMFDVGNLLCMAGIYAGLAWLVDPRKRFQLHLWNVLCTTPILGLVALVTQRYSAAWTRQLIEGGVAEFTWWAATGPWIILAGYAWCARLVYAALRNNAGFGRFRAASVAVVGFGGTLAFLEFSLKESYVLLLKALTS